MRKKNLLIGLVTACVTVVMGLSLTACGNDGDSPANVKGEQVTAEQWEKAFDFSGIENVTLKVVEVSREGDEQMEKTTIQKYDGDKMHIHETAVGTDETGTEKETEELFKAKENGKIFYYEYDEDGKTWFRYADEYSDADEWGLASDYDFSTYAKNFEKFTYDKEKKGYTCTEERNGNTSTLLFKIDGGKLVYAEMNNTEGKHSYSSSIEFYDAGKTSVTLPEASDGSDNS